MRSKTTKVALLAVMVAMLAMPAMASDAGTADSRPVAAEVATAESSTPTEQPAAEAIKEAASQGKETFADFKGGKYREGIAGLITLLVFLWRRFAGKLVIGKLGPWGVACATTLVAYLATIPEALAVSPWSWWTFLWSGLATTGESMVFWSLIGKKMLPKVFGQQPSSRKQDGAVSG